MDRTSAGSARVVLICHNDEPLNCRGLARWLAGFTNLVGLVVIREPNARLLKRIKREIRRVGLFRSIDVLFFQLYYRLFLASADYEWEKIMLQKLETLYCDVPAKTQRLDTSNPNTRETEQFLEELEPDLIIARCKSILNARIFAKARIGTFVMHPGICPEYRNAHGCFWALANRDITKVGMTLLKIDSGVDTGPVYGYYTYPYNEQVESHIVIQNRVVFENLDSLKKKFCEISSGTAPTINTQGRSSRAWGQPWLTQYFRWRRAVKQEKKRNSYPNS